MKLLPVTALLVLSLFSMALAQQRATALEEGTISVVGSGVVYGTPDKATVQVGAAILNEDVQVAVDELDQAIAAIMAALTDLGIPQENIRTVSFNVWSENRYGPEGRIEQSEYRAQHMLAVEVEGAERAGEVLTAAVDAGANNVGGIDFGFSNPGELKARARELALDDARDRAGQLAAAAGVELGAPVSIAELAPVGGIPMVGFERSMASVDAAQVAPGQLSVEVQVAVAFELVSP